MNDICSIAFDEIQASNLSSIADEPAALLAVIAELENPLVAVFNQDISRKLFTTLDQDFDFIRVARATMKPFSPMERDKVVTLFRWVISELRQWRRDSDRADSKLAALLFVLHANNQELCDVVDTCIERIYCIKIDCRLCIII